jgi:alkylation response protein AidB-like acyl-CoA dehydrogenase
MEEGASKTGVTCMERERLARELDGARSSYSRAAETLRGRVGVLEKAEYQRLNRAVEEAWTKMEDARAALDRHIDEHRC